MSLSPRTELSSDGSPRATAIGGWLRARGLAFPALLLVDLLAPFGWLLGQGYLVVEPLAALAGVDRTLGSFVRLLDDPDERYALREELSRGTMDGETSSR